MGRDLSPAPAAVDKDQMSKKSKIIHDTLSWGYIHQDHEDSARLTASIAVKNLHCYDPDTDEAVLRLTIEESHFLYEALKELQEHCLDAIEAQRGCGRG